MYVSSKETALIGLAYVADNRDLYRVSDTYKGKSMRTLCALEEFNPYCSATNVQARPACFTEIYTPTPESYARRISPLSKEYLHHTDCFLAHLHCNSMPCFVSQLRYEHNLAARECTTVSYYFERVTAAAQRTYLDNLSDHGNLLREVLLRTG